LLLGRIIVLTLFNYSLYEDDYRSVSLVHFICFLLATRSGDDFSFADCMVDIAPFQNHRIYTGYCIQTNWCNPSVSFQVNQSLVSFHDPITFGV
jgi:hypothetical protein